MQRLVTFLLVILIILILLGYRLKLDEGTTMPQKSNNNSMLGTNPDTYTPKYTQVKNYQKCLLTQSQGSWDSWCLPTEKPSECSLDSWEQLQALSLSTCHKD